MYSSLLRWRAVDVSSDVASTAFHPLFGQSRKRVEAPVAYVLMALTLLIPRVGTWLSIGLQCTQKKGGKGIWINCFFVVVVIVVIVDCVCGKNNKGTG